MRGFHVCDYFSKYGFRDGDNEKLVEFAREVREKVLGELNKEMERRKMGLRAVAVDYNTCHNPVRAEVEWEDEFGPHAYCEQYGVDDEFANMLVTEASLRRSFAECNCSRSAFRFETALV